VFFLYIYEYGTLKPVEIILRRGREKSDNNRMNLTGVHYMHIWKCHNETPIQLLHTNKKVQKDEVCFKGFYNLERITNVLKYSLQWKNVSSGRAPE
jgi:hypothetical protein